MLKLIGYWIRTLDDEQCPAPQELVGELTSEVRAALVGYLAGGLRLIQYRGYSWCRFDCGVEYQKLGSWELTDGTWVWPEGLAHYVEAHGVVLPEEFISHALSGAVPVLPDAKPDPREDYDEADFWLSWCSTRRSAAITEGLRSTLVKAQAQTLTVRAARIEALEQKEGLSSELCNWAGCKRKALTSRSVCAEHLPDYGAETRIGLFNALREYLSQLPGGGKA